MPLKGEFRKVKNFDYFSGVDEYLKFYKNDSNFSMLYV